MPPDTTTTATSLCLQYVSAVGGLLGGVAAVLAVIVARWSVLSQRKTALDAHRPELHLSGWDVYLRSDNDIGLSLDKVENLGVGPAFDISAEVSIVVNSQERPVPVLYGLQPMKKGECRDWHYNRTLTFAEHSVREADGDVINITVRLHYRDIAGRTYTTSHNLRSVARYEQGSCVGLDTVDMFRMTKGPSN